MSQIIELVQSIKLEKEDCKPIEFAKGTLFKVQQDFPNCYLVSTDEGFTFTLAKEDENKTWVKF
ncbi:hypothetical protein [Acinetobacter sp.]|uniref:hypothetical protein n=1 Tax=Acinetobacter sp. TaxID=472 RepID=UPI0031DCE9D0